MLDRYRVLTTTQDCRKVTASMFASNFIVKDTALKHNRGKDKLTKFTQSKTIATGNGMSNCFCSACGTLMYRVSEGFPGMSILRIGTVDDFNLHETKLKPRIEQFGKDRVSWFKGGEGVEQVGLIIYGSAVISTDLVCRRILVITTTAVTKGLNRKYSEGQHSGRWLFKSCGTTL